MKPHKTNLVKRLFNGKSLLMMIVSMMLLTMACTPSYASTYPGDQTVTESGDVASQLKDSKEPATTTRQANPNQTYQWVGKVVVQ